MFILKRCDEPTLHRHLPGKNVAHFSEKKDLRLLETEAIWSALSLRPFRERQAAIQSFSRPDNRVLWHVARDCDDTYPAWAVLPSAGYDEEEGRKQCK